MSNGILDIYPDIIISCQAFFLLWGSIYLILSPTVFLSFVVEWLSDNILEFGISVLNFCDPRPPLHVDRHTDTRI